MSPSFPAASGGHPVGLEAIFASVGTVFFSVVAALAGGLLVLAFLAERASTGTPSWVSRISAAVAAREGGPLWGAFPFGVVLGGMLLALVGWRAAGAGGPLAVVGPMALALGVVLATLGGVMASALAHPTASERAAGVEDAIARPLPARTVFAHRRVLPGAFGSGPVGAVVVLVGGVVAVVGLPVATVWRALEGRSLDGVVSAQVPVLVAVVAMAAGAWLLRAESRNAVAAASGRVVRPRDAGEAVGAAAVLLALSAAADLGVPTALLAAAGAVTLVAARARLGAGGALLAVAGYAGVRVVVALVTGTLGASGVAPLLVPALLAAAAVEVALAVLGDRVLGVPAARPQAGLREFVAH